MHLDPAHPAQYQLALDFFDQNDGVDNLYILGDLFEYWIGDDAGLPMYADIITSLAALSRRGCGITVMLGNRDFLLGESFAEAASVVLCRDDELLVMLDDEPLLLMHGDTLCTEDHDYQKFRQQVRDELWQAAFLKKSIDERLTYAASIREQSRKLSAHKTHELMDVNGTMVTQRLAAHQCQRLIHGHTHRPDVHIDEQSGNCRMVVGDWHATHARYVVKNAEGFHLECHQRRGSTRILQQP